MITQFDIDKDMQLYRAAYSLVCAGKIYTDWRLEAADLGCPASKLVSIWQAAEDAFCCAVKSRFAFPLSSGMDGKILRKFVG